MKKLFAIFLLLVTPTLFAQDVTGPWHGLISFPGGSLRFSMNITKTAAGTYTATADSPDQGVKGKYSIVPYPACVGWVDREMPGWTKRELNE